MENSITRMITEKVILELDTVVDPPKKEKVIDGYAVAKAPKQFMENIV